MKRNLFLLLALCSLGFFISCTKDSLPDYAKDIEGTYKGNVTIGAGLSTTTEVQKAIVTRISYNKITVVFNNFMLPISGQATNLGIIEAENISIEPSAGDIIYIIPQIVDLNLNVGETTKPAKVTVGGTVNKGVINLTINIADIEATDINVTFNGDKINTDEEKTQAYITAMTFDSDVVLVQPVIEGMNIIFYVADTTNPDRLKALIPSITISDGATINPLSGVAQNFSQGSISYTVTAQDEINKNTYTVTCGKMAKYNFENWVDSTYKIGETSPIVYCQEAKGWSSTNKGVAYIKSFLGSFSGVPVTATSDSKTGTKAAKIETFNTSGAGIFVPYITSGSLFLGSYEFDTNAQRSTYFGNPYSKQPVKFSGWYKYTPGANYYVAEKGKPGNATINATMVDSCSIVAVLYEVTDVNAEYLTGEDLLTSSKVVMTAILPDGSKKDNWTQFQLDFTQASGKTYDPAKTYKLAIVCSSSKNGNKYSGAPGSVLIVDDLEIISK